MLTIKEVLIKLVALNCERYFIVLNRDIMLKRNVIKNYGNALTYNHLTKHLLQLQPGISAKIYFSTKYEISKSYADCPYSFEFYTPETKAEFMQQLISYPAAVSAAALQQPEVIETVNDTAMPDSISLDKYLDALNEKHELKTKLILLEQENKQLKAELERPKFLDKVGNFLENNQGLIAGFLSGAGRQPQQSYSIAGVGASEIPSQQTEVDINSERSAAAERLKQAIAQWQSADANFIERIEWLAAFATQQPEQYKAVINMQGIGSKIQ